MNFLSGQMVVFRMSRIANIPKKFPVRPLYRNLCAGKRNLDLNYSVIRCLNKSEVNGHKLFNGSLNKQMNSFIVQ